jgi:SAM-dependent methyltransferase
MSPPLRQRHGRTRQGVGAGHNGVMAAADELATGSTYDVVADAYADHFKSTEAEQPLELAMIDHFAGLLPNPRVVLDAGCGAGRMLPHLAAYGCDVQGVDLSVGMIRRAQMDHPEFATMVGSLTGLAYADASFDGVFSWYSTIHSPDEDLEVILGEFRRVLRRGGYLLLAFQCGEGMREVGQGFRDRGLDVMLNRWHRRPEALISRLQAAGLSTVARMEREPLAGEGDPQAVIIARKPGLPSCSGGRGVTRRAVAVLG